MSNRYPGSCASCRCSVPAEAGRAFRDPSGRWAVACASAACQGQLGLAASAPAGPRESTRRLDADGTVRTPYEAENVPLVKSMPGARWDPAAKVWRVSVTPADLPRTLELARRLRLEIAAELLAAQDPPAVVAARERARAMGAYPYQITGAEWLARRNSVLLADMMGLGKTLQVIAALPEDRGCLVVCPATLKRTWEDEIARWRPSLRVVVLAGRDAWQDPEPGTVIVTNFDILPSWLTPRDTGQTSRNGRSIRRATIAPATRAALASCVLVVDEAHKAKNYRAQRSQKLTELSRACTARWLLTATPLPNRPPDLYGVLEAGGMAQEVFGGWRGFVRLFNGTKGRWGGWDWGRPEAEATERLRRVMIRRTKAEVLPDLPKKVWRDIRINGIDAETRRGLDDVMDTWGEVIAGGDLPPFEEMSRVRAELAAQKIPALLELVEDYEEAGEPLVVFSAHRAPIDALGARDGWGRITGDETADARHATKEAFQAGRLKGIALTIAAGGVGITLTRASHEIFVDLAWNPADNVQAEDRCHRIGQTAESVQITRLVAEHPLDRRVTEILAQKTRLVAAAMDQYLTATVRVPAGSTAPTIDETDAELDARMARARQAVEDAERQEGRARLLTKLVRERERAVLPEEPLTPERRQMVRDALAAMLAECDGAVTRDGVGFNKPDAWTARTAAATGMADHDETVHRVVERILTRYHRQLAGTFPGLWTKGA